MIAARLREHGLDTWREMIGRLASLEWANDPSKRDSKHANWKPHIVWFAKSATFLKLLEGVYGGAPAPVNWEAALRVFREHQYWNPSNGPAPGMPGYRGPAIPTEPDLLSQGGQR
jgi:hypothetical protein